MTIKKFKVAIVGGGIVGCGLLRDLSLHDIPTLLINKGDFAAQTSSNSSKMLHGGIRYLENFDFDLVQEALEEKNNWIKLAPHLCKEVPFIIPVFKESKYPLAFLGLGLKLYDFLSLYQNSPHQILNEQQVIKHFPDILTQGLVGGGLYNDAIVDDSKLALENIYDALENPKCDALNYQSLKSVQYLQNGEVQINTKDDLTSVESSFLCEHLVFATGPFTDHLIKDLNIFPWTDKLLPSQGAHIWLNAKKLPVKTSLVLQTKDNRIIFVIPHWGGAVLVGTTETEPADNYFNVKAKPEEIAYLLNAIQKYFPNANITEKDILGSYAGIRPLVRESDAHNAHEVSRVHKIYRPREDTFVILGGKYTTFRKMVQDIAEVIVGKNQKSYNPNKTLKPLKRNSVVSSFDRHDLKIEDIYKIIELEKVRTFEDLISRRLAIQNSSRWFLDESMEQFFNPLMKDLAKKILVPEDFKKFFY